MIKSIFLTTQNHSGRHGEASYVIQFSAGVHLSWLAGMVWEIQCFPGMHRPDLDGGWGTVDKEKGA